MKQALAEALKDRGYASLTAVQDAVTQADVIGADLLVSAQTGSGKTLGFGLAIAPTLLGAEEAFPRAALPLALILAPTRELAMQVKRELTWLYAKTGAVIASCVGGMDMRDERRSLQRGAHMVVATPGRLRDHIARGSIDLSAVRAVVLDEADEMLDLGFREDLEFILGEAPEDRQTLLFSATVPKAIATLAKQYQRDAIRISTAAETSQHADIDYQAMSVAARDAENAIINVLRFYEAPNALVFVNTRAMVNRITTRLSNRGFSVVALSGELSQSERTHALQAMRDGRAKICVATDVAARGIDLPNLDLVVHAELPSNHETLLHRSGRTGRAGRKGVSVLIVPPAARRKAERILGAAKLRATWGAAPSAAAIRTQDDERMMADPVWGEEIAEAERPAVDALLARFGADQIAARFLRLHASGRSAPEELSEIDASPRSKPSARFNDGVWISVSGGRRDGAEPKRLIPMLCKAGDVTSEDIGAIRIGQEESFVQIRQSSAAQFFASIEAGGRLEGGARILQVDAPPADAGPPRKGPKPARRPGPAHDGHRSREQGARSAESRTSEERDWRPAEETGPKGPPPPKSKPSSKKNKARKLAAKFDEKPARGKPAYKPRSAR